MWNMLKQIELIDNKLVLVFKKQEIERYGLRVGDYLDVGDMLFERENGRRFESNYKEA